MKIKFSLLSIAVIMLIMSCISNTHTTSTIKIEVFDWKWNIDTISLIKGEVVILEITNTGQMPHGIWIPELGINEDVRAGKMIQVKLTPHKVGEFTVRCSVPACGTAEQHVGMVTTMVITE